MLRKLLAWLIDSKGLLPLKKYSELFRFGVFQESKSLSTLYLSSNNIGPDGAKFLAEGIKDSKRVTSDRAIKILASKIRKTRGIVIKTAWAGMSKYNELYNKFGRNLNKLLAWFHARAATDALEEKLVPWGLLDQFSKQPLVQRQLKVKGFDLQMRTKAEEDPVVAAASIIARAEYVRQMEKLSDQAGVQLPKGASDAVKDAAREIISKHGANALHRFAKMHFAMRRHGQR